MTLLVGFIDGFTSASAPSVSGGSQEDYTILNNQAAAVEIFTLDASEFKSAFISFELERIDSIDEYRQAGNIIMSYNGSSWDLNFGNYQGDAIAADTLASTYNVVFSMPTSLGVGSFKYTSGNMAGTGYSGSMRIIITRVITA